MSTEIEKHLDNLKSRWPSEFVARERVYEFTGGFYSSKSLANYDSLKIGPKIVIRTGKKVGYPVDSFCEWLLERLKVGKGKPVPKNRGNDN